MEEHTTPRFLTPFRRMRATKGIVRDYCDGISSRLGLLTPTNIEAAIKYARIPDPIRGFGLVKKAGL